MNHQEMEATMMSINHKTAEPRPGYQKGKQSKKSIAALGRSRSLPCNNPSVVEGASEVMGYLAFEEF